MEYRVRLTPRAADDIGRIYRRITQAAPLAGQKWFNRLVDKVYSLVTFPERCRVVESISRPNRMVRELLFGRKPHVYRIYFDIAEDTVRVLHIRHAARRESKRNG